MKKRILLTFVSTLATLLVVTQNSFADKTASVLPEKTILSVLMKNLDVPLKNAAHCDDVGMDEHDRTIGDYLSGFWSFHTDRQSQNWLEVNATKSVNNRYLAKVMIYQKNKEENWGWGVSFERDSQKKIRKGSFTCLGSG